MPSKMLLSFSQRQDTTSPADLIVDATATFSDSTIQPLRFSPYSLTDARATVWVTVTGSPRWVNFSVINAQNGGTGGNVGMNEIAAYGIPWSPPSPPPRPPPPSPSPPSPPSPSPPSPPSPPLPRPPPAPGAVYTVACWNAQHRLRAAPLDGVTGLYPDTGRQTCGGACRFKHLLTL